jgi:hypothetical protein
MWAVVVACAVPFRRGRDTSVLVAATLMALAFTVTVHPVYLSLDARLGGRNVSDLVKQTLFVGAVYFLSRGIAKAVGGPVIGRGIAWVVPAVVVVVQTVAFSQVSMTSGTTTNFMSVYGGQLPAMVYSMAHFVYFGVTLGAAGVACLRSGWRQAPRAVRSGIGFLIAGSASSVVTAVLLVVRDVIAVTGRSALAASVNRGYGPLLLLSVALVAAGLAIPQLSGGAARRRIARELPGLVAGLEALRDRASSPDRRLRLPVGVQAPGGKATPLDELHRLVVEVHDEMFLDPGFVPTAEERQVLARSEQLVSRLELT